MVGLVHVAVQFPCYEKLKQLLSERRERISHTRELQPVDLILASALSKVGAWLRGRAAPLQSCAQGAAYWLAGGWAGLGCREPTGQ